MLSKFLKISLLDIKILLTYLSYFDQIIVIYIFVLHVHIFGP
jgi:hypothetical protein